MASIRRPTRLSFALVVSITCALVALFALAGNAGAATRTGGTGTDPWIASELPDYAPGSTVNLLGGSWQPGEAVHINVNDNDGQTWSRDVDVSADPNGDISDSFTLPNWFVAQYTVTATGTSGTATTTFTDGNLTVHLATADQASPAPSSISFTYTTFNQDSSCATSGTTQTTASQPTPFNVGIGGGNNSARAVSAAASGYTFTYFSSSATSTTPLTASQLCYSNSGDVFAHFTLATRSTSTSLVSNTNPSTFGQSVTFTATVTASAGNPGANGSATFKDGTSTITGCSNIALNASSQATCTTSALDAAGSPHSVTAVYSGATSGGTTWNGSTSSPLSQTVNKASSTTTVTCTAGPFVYNGSAKTPCSATVTGAGGLNQSLSVSYSDNVNAGTATASASYAGDANHNASSDSKTFTIDKASSTTTVSCSAGPFVYNGTAQTPCSASVSGAGGLSQSLSVSYSNNTHAGSATASASYAGDANHEGSNDSQTFTIAKRDVTASISAADKTYDGTDDAEITGCSFESATGNHGVVSGDAVGCAASNGHFADANAGSGKTVSADVALTGTAKDDYQLTGASASTTAGIDRRPVTASIGAADKTYDGSDAAALTGCSLEAQADNHGVVSPDDVDCTASNGHFADRHAGAGKSVTADVELTGANRANYQLTSGSAATMAGIAQRPVTASISAADKTYDGNDSAAVDSCSLESATGNHGVVSLDDVDCAASNGHFASKHAGTGKSVSADVALTGADKSDYELTSGSASTTAAIERADLEISAATDTKVYDGTTSSTAVPTVSGLQGTDTVTGKTQAFASKNVLGVNGSTLNVSAYIVNDGNSGGNYDVHTHTAAGTITAAALHISAVGDSKTYDGNTSSNGTPTVTGLQTGDSVTGKTQAFQSKDVLGPNGSTLVVTGYTVNDGNSGGNYGVTTHTAAGTITKKGLTVSGITASDKVFDGNSTASLSLGGAALVGVISPDSVTLNTSAAAGTFANSAVGTWAVTISGLMLSGSASGNYSLSQPATTASILPWNAAGRGFYAPVGADAAHSLFTPAPGITPTVKPSTMDWNSAKGGSTVPLKFNVFAGSAEKTTADAFPGANLATAFNAMKLNVCSDATSEDPVDFTTTGSTNLRYDGTAGQWIQNWKTPNVTGDSCYRAWVTLADGSTLEAFFKLKK